MAENLNYNADGSACNKNDPANCDTYGRLYDWATALDIDVSCNTRTLSDCGATVSSKHRGICPSGWHVPSMKEWETLIYAVGGYLIAGTNLKSTSGWDCRGISGNGTDDYGFSILSGGSGSSDGSFGDVGYYGMWWSATEDTFDKNGRYAGYRGVGYDSEGIDDANSYKSELYSVRCLKD